MSQTSFKIDIDKISYELKKANPSFGKMQLESITGKSSITVNSWKKEAPDVVELLHSLGKSFDMDFNKMIMASSDTYPVIKLLKYYYSETKNDLVEILIIPE